jgi:hypothetical protein
MRASGSSRYFNLSSIVCCACLLSPTAVASHAESAFEHDDLPRIMRPCCSDGSPNGPRRRVDDIRLVPGAPAVSYEVGTTSTGTMVDDRTRYAIEPGGGENAPCSLERPITMSRARQSTAVEAIRSAGRPNATTSSHP